MKPGTAVMPWASMVCMPEAFGAPAPTETIFPPRATMEPFSITLPLPTMMRTLVIARFCAARCVAPAMLAKKASATKTRSLFIGSSPRFRISVIDRLDDDNYADMGRFLTLEGFDFLVRAGQRVRGADRTRIATGGLPRYRRREGVFRDRPCRGVPAHRESAWR